MDRIESRSIVVALGAALIALQPLAAAAQEPAGGAMPPSSGAAGTMSYAASVSAGTFNYDAGGDQYYPFVAIRASRQLSYFFIAEVGVGLAAAETEIVGVETRREATPLLLPDALLQFQFPLGSFRPYLGLGLGLVAQLSSSEARARFIRPSYTGAGGFRLDMGERMGLRGDLRVRLDTHPDFTAFDFEHSVGALVRF